MSKCTLVKRYRRVFLLIFILEALWISAEGGSRNLSVRVGTNRELTFKDVDTLMPNLAGSAFVLSYESRIRWEATKFTPQMPCSIREFWHGVYGPAGSSKKCSLFVWADTGAPGAKLFGDTMTITASGWNYYHFASPLYVSGTFWAGNREWDTLEPTTVMTNVMSFPTKWSQDGVTWQDWAVDYQHAVVVHYSVTGTPKMLVAPTYLNFQIDSTSNKLKQDGSPRIGKSIISSREDDWQGINPGSIIIGYDNSIDVHKASSSELSLTGKGITIVHKGLTPLNYVVVKIPGKSIDDMKSFIATMKDKPKVKYVVPDRQIQLLLTPDDPGWSKQWGPQDMNCPKAWELGLGSKNITLAVLDVGVDYTHEDLNAQFGDTVGYDFVDGDTDPMPTSSDHGTFCSGIACATINNGIGLAGTSNVHLYALRVLAGGKNSTLDAGGDAIQWCANNKINVVSMSWGFGGDGTGPVQDACVNAYNAGCLLCAASGNSGDSSLLWPAGYDQVIAVGAIDQSDNRASFSTYGPKLELAAPGVSIYSCSAPALTGNKYTTASGTSASCPFVAGGAALVWSANLGLTNQEVRGILDSTAVDLGAPGRDEYYGYGKPDLYAAVELAGGTTMPKDTGMLTVYNQSSATGNLYVLNATWKASWILSVSPTNFEVMPGQSKGMTVIVGGKLHTGVYTDTLEITSNDSANSPYPIPITLKVGNGVEEDNSKFEAGTLGLDVYPDPFYRQAKIRFQVPIKAHNALSPVTLKLYDIGGRAVKTFLEERKEAGMYNLSINMGNLVSGIYFMSLRIENKEISKKVILIH